MHLRCKTKACGCYKVKHVLWFHICLYRRGSEDVLFWDIRLYKRGNRILQVLDVILSERSESNGSHNWDRSLTARDSALRRCCAVRLRTSSFAREPPKLTSCVSGNPSPLRMTTGGFAEVYYVTSEGTADLKPLPRFIGGERQSFCQAFFKKRLFKESRLISKKGLNFFVQYVIMHNT